MEYKISIVDGTGTKRLPNGEYNVTSNVPGYIDATLNPPKITVENNIKTYNFTISAGGTLTIHVTDTGTTSGVPIVGAEFYRCDQEGVTYGTAIITNEQGNAIFQNVPYDATDAPEIYYKQTASDGEHSYDDSVQNTTLTTFSKTIELQNEDTLTRTLKLTDDSYGNLPIENGELTLNNN